MRDNKSSEHLSLARNKIEMVWREALCWREAWARAPSFLNPALPIVVLLIQYMSAIWHEMTFGLPICYWVSPIK